MTEKVQSALLAGAVDLHVHGAPDIAPRRHTDLELARRAQSAGMAAIVLKSHLESTVGRAALASEATGFPVYGGLVLNPWVTGGLDPDAVEVSLALGARIIWLPSLGSDAHTAAFGQRGRRWTGLRHHPAQMPVAARSIDIDVGDRRVGVVLAAICRAIARADTVLATGHMGRSAIGRIAAIADRFGARLIVTHPDYAVPALSPAAQLELVQEFPSVTLERAAYVASPAWPGHLEVAVLVAAIRATGVGRNVVTSDLGQPGNAPYPDGLASFAEALLIAGLGRDQLRWLLADGPRRLLLGTGSDARQSSA